MALVANTKRVAQMAAEGRADEFSGTDLIILIGQNIDAFKDDHVLRDPVTWELHPEAIIKLMTKDEIISKLKAAGKIQAKGRFKNHS